MGSYLVTGHIVFDDPAEIAGATVRVLLEDTSRADAAAIVIAQSIMHDVRHRSGEPIPFRVEADASDPRRHFTLRAHVDVDNNGEVSAGDYISTVSLPVLSFPARVDIHVKKVQ